MNVLPEKQRLAPQNKKVVENKPRLGQGRAGIRHKKPKPVEGIITSTSISCKIPKIPTSQNVTKNNMDFMVQEQLITSKTEAIMNHTKGQINLIFKNQENYKV